jgi:uncharacterized protein (TIGR03435 family)
MRLTMLLAFGLAAYGQSPAFEVASIKVAPPADGRIRVGCNGMPGTKELLRWSCENLTLHNLITVAYDLKRYELSGIEPSGGDRYQIEARLPAGVTPEQFRLMVQNLLAERFALNVHREKKEMAAYELVVAKGGPKFKESAPEPPADPAADPPRPSLPPSFTRDKDGFPEIPEGRSGTIMTNGMAARRAVRETMAQFTAGLSNQVGRPVIDGTGLTGKYDMLIRWSLQPPAPPRPPGAEGTVPVAADPAGPTIFMALQEQLGLKLESKKAMVEIVVVDSYAKTPSEN